jgi:uncharacterized damage-inducible protein DinB
MDKHDLVSLFVYNQWANDRILQAAALMKAEQYAAPVGISHGSIRSALVHIYGVEVLYRLRCQEGISPTSLAAEEDFPDLITLKSHWNVETIKMMSYLDGSKDRDLDRTIHYLSIRGEERVNKLWQMLMQVILHGMQTRSEVAVALTQAGCSPGNLDWIYFAK